MNEKYKPITSMKEVPEHLRKLCRQYLRYQQAKGRRKWKMSSNVWMFSDEIESIGISKSRLTKNIEKRIIIKKCGISYINACVGGDNSGSDERLCCPSG